MNLHSDNYHSPTNEDFAGLGTDPISAEPYYRPEYFELEREAIFRRSWLQIGHVCELPAPDSFIVRPVEVLNASVLITRDKGGDIRAFHNVCTHRGTELVAEESGKRATFTCRYHAWTFDTDGQLRAAPDFERFYIDKQDCSLPKIAVEVCAGLIFINFDKLPAQSLREFLGPLAEQLETMPVARATGFSEWFFELEANWKLVQDNFQENYHLRFIHPRSSAAGRGEDNPFGYAASFEFLGQHRKQQLWSSPSPMLRPTSQFAMGKLAELAIADGLFDNAHTRETFGVFPNLHIIGTPVSHFSLAILPVTATRSRGVFRMYWVGKDRCATERFGREIAMISTVEVHAEDGSVLESGQRGISSGAIEHIHFQSQEVRCRHLFVNIGKAVQAYADERNSAGASA